MTTPVTPVPRNYGCLAFSRASRRPTVNHAIRRMRQSLFAISIISAIFSSEPTGSAGPLPDTSHRIRHFRKIAARSRCRPDSSACTIFSHFKTVCRDTWQARASAVFDFPATSIASRSLSPNVVIFRVLILGLLRLKFTSERSARSVREIITHRWAIVHELSGIKKFSLPANGK